MDLDVLVKVADWLSHASPWLAAAYTGHSFYSTTLQHVTQWRGYRVDLARISADRETALARISADRETALARIAADREPAPAERTADPQPGLPSTATDRNGERVGGVA